MPEKTPTPTEEEKPRFFPRKAELEQLAKTLPIDGVEHGNNRVFNIWGEHGVGKSSFISEFRECELMSNAKVLWLQPTRNDSLDDIPEFIRACAQTVRYPAKPTKEKKIADLLESVQRGKVNPIVSDDSILITRSSIAKDKKRYINQAAASSVGRTEVVRDDFEINVGLGESKANNHAEAFLDALPLKSLGTDLTIIYIEKYGNLSITILDWLRDYVLPAATRGAYRRSLVFLVESLDPLELAYPLETWGEWSNLTEDIRLYPLRKADALQLAIGFGHKPRTARYLQCESLGYPGDLYKSAKRTKALNRDAAKRFLDSLVEADQLKVAILCLPPSIHQDDLFILFGAAASEIYKWFRQLPNELLSESSSGKSLTVSEALRCESISRFANSSDFQAHADAWAPMGRLARNVPSRNDRSKLLLLSGLAWIDSELCSALFKDQANKILPFVTDSTYLFNRKQQRFCISGRLSEDLQLAAKALQHPGLGIVLQKATALWDDRKAELEGKISELKTAIETNQAELDSLTKRQNETVARIRIHDAQSSDEPAPHKSGGFISKILKSSHDDEDPESPQGLRKTSKALATQIHESERTIDGLNLEQKILQTALNHPYVHS